jgi:hypothetical protein
MSATFLPRHLFTRLCYRAALSGRMLVLTEEIGWIHGLLERLEARKVASIRPPDLSSSKVGSFLRRTDPDHMMIVAMRRRLCDLL